MQASLSIAGMPIDMVLRSLSATMKTFMVTYLLTAIAHGVLE